MQTKPSNQQLAKSKVIEALVMQAVLEQEPPDQEQSPKPKSGLTARELLDTLEERTSGRDLT